MYTRRISPSIMTRLRWTLGLYWRFVLFLERGTLYPTIVPLPQISHFAIDFTSDNLVAAEPFLL
jgi:hypothetical protein